jgi:hypothetical protein
MKTAAILISALILAAGAALAQQPNLLPVQQASIEYTPGTCVLGGEMPVFNAALNHEGLFRAFFRRVGATDWCSVDGTNNNKLSTVTLPKFDTGDEFEYYFVLIDNKRIIAKSPQIYHTKAEATCDAPFTRHSTLLTMQCLQPGGSGMATSNAAGYAITTNDTPVASPDRPSQATSKQ